MSKKDDDARKSASETVPDQRWKLQVFYLCFYGFMTQIRPGESFITPYLLGAETKFTKAEILWNEIYPATDNSRVYNGGVDAASTLLGAGASFAAGYVKIRWTLWSELVIGLVTAFQAGLLLLMNTTSNIWLCYIAYVLFRGSHQFLVPIAIFQIATSLSKELCALIFGVNTFFATVLKTIITIVVADKRGLGLSVHPQFYVYFGYFTLLAVVYLLAAVSVGIRHSPCKQPAELALAKEPCQLPDEVSAQEKSPEACAVRA